MQRFTLIHDGSDQGWQATYLAFHVATRLGAPLQALIIDSGNDKTALAQRAAQVEIGGRAAGVATETDLLPDASMDSLKEYITAADGLFLSARLIPDRKSAARFLETFACPLWIASKGSEINKLAVLVSDPLKDIDLMNYTNALSHRLEQSLAGLIEESKLDLLNKEDVSAFNWMAVPTLAIPNLITAIKKLNTNLLFISASNLFEIEKLPCNFVICPNIKNV